MKDHAPVVQETKPENAALQHNQQIMENQKVWYLKQIDLFKNISDKEIISIAQKLIEKKCNKKEILYSPFENFNSICLLKKGEVTLYYSHRGKRIIIDVLKPGSIFGNINFKEGKKEHFAEVTENSLICIFEINDFLKIIQARPEIMLRFLKIISEKLSDYENRLKSNLFDAKEKIIHQLELLNKKNFFNKLITKNTYITHDKLAEYLGLSRETVTRAITTLKKEGKINYNQKGQVTLK